MPGHLKQGDSMSDPSSPTSKPLMTRSELREFLNSEGFPLGESTFEKICMPSRGEGPEVEAWWGPRPLYDPERGLEWAKSRLTKTRIRKT
jgi:hypothetical protein